MGLSIKSPPEQAATMASTDTSVPGSNASYLAPAQKHDHEGVAGGVDDGPLQSGDPGPELDLDRRTRPATLACWRGAIRAIGPAPSGTSGSTVPISARRGRRRRAAGRPGRPEPARGRWWHRHRQALRRQDPSRGCRRRLTVARLSVRVIPGPAHFSPPCTLSQWTKLSHGTQPQAPPPTLSSPPASWTSRAHFFPPGVMTLPSMSTH